MGRKPKNDHAPGIYKRGSTYWLRYSLGGQQLRTSLETNSYVEAVEKAARKRGEGPKADQEEWNVLIDRYISLKKKRGDFSKNTVLTVKQAISSFKSFVKDKAIDDINDSHIEKFYESTRTKKAESTAQGCTLKALGFLRWTGKALYAPKFKAAPKVRDIVVPLLQIKELIGGCLRPDLKFVLLAGFQHGMRKDEIVMAKPSWFNLDLHTIKVPQIQGDWSPKSGRGRVIPLSPDFLQFLKFEFGEWQQEKWMLHSSANGQRYRWDFRRPFDEYMTARGCTEVTPHVMRHSYITHLARGGVPLSFISEWSGDRIKTLESNYLHVEAPQGIIGDVFAGRNQEDKMREAAYGALMQAGIAERATHDY